MIAFRLEVLRTEVIFIVCILSLRFMWCCGAHNREYVILCCIICLEVYCNCSVNLQTKVVQPFVNELITMNIASK